MHTLCFLFKLFYSFLYVQNGAKISARAYCKFANVISPYFTVLVLGP